MADQDVTSLLQAWSGGNTTALDQLVPMVQAELRRLACVHLRHERPDHTLQPTALVNEVYLRLVDQRRVQWRNRAQFFGAAAQMMRRILVDYGRQRRRVKRGGRATHVSLDAAVGVATPSQGVDVLTLDAALDRLARLDHRQSEIVVLRFFGGLSINEVAAVMGVSSATVKRDWSAARLWLHRELRGARG